MSLAPKKNTYVDGEIARVVAKMQDTEVDSDEYAELLERTAKLHKIRQDEKPDQVSSDALLAAAVNIVGIALIIRHEHVNVITSKAMSFVGRSRL